ncbi:MAG: 4-hydroxy-tetrahydrodipicolinate reductase [Bacteroidota bacterium]
MNIAIIGYGRMGKEIETIANERNITIKKIFTSKNNIAGTGLTKQSLKGVDVCLEFSTPDTAFDNVSAALSAGKNVVCGTTGWMSKMNDAKKLASKNNVGFLFAANFSIGLNIFSHILASASELFNKFDDYDVFIHELHHAQKKDSPSGTALSLASTILQNFPRKKEIVADKLKQPIATNQLHVTSSRAGYWIGQHKVVFDSEVDIIELTHTARNRRGFALGALTAAKWLQGKQGCFSMQDVIFP